MDSHQREAERLRQDVEWALRRALDPGEVLPMLHRLVRRAADGSEESVFAHRNLAELLVERDPWRAALHARKVLAHRPDDDRGWAMLGLCQTLLGHYRYAVSAYHQALRGAPSNPWYAHNLGHLLDVALSRPKEAIGWLKSAYSGASWSGEIAASYAHALARIGELAEAKKVVTKAMKKGESREHSALLRWLEQGAPPAKDQPAPSPAIDAGAVPPPLPDAAVRPTKLPRLTQDVGAKPPRRRRDATADAAELELALRRGLASLPLDAKQRGRAKDLARDALAHFARPIADVPTLAAAVAYAIVYIDHVPLKPAEVAACFRVGVSSLRGRFGELRANLDLMRGDTRYGKERP